ncbi:MAG: hypothetical protein ABL974_18220 [Prosthecobacter sp.]
MNLRPLIFLSLVALVSCESSAPTAEQMDALQTKIRAEHREEYATLEQQRATGQMSAEQYVTERSSLDKRVQNKVDNMLWNRHALVQSEMRANGIPTPDAPVALDAPGVGQSQGSLYTSSRMNGLGNQIQGGFMRDIGGSNFNQNRAGTIHDNQ